MAEAEVDSLEFLLNKATSPARFEEDKEYISRFCDKVNEELDGQLVAVKLLAHKFQSPQEREALFALSTLEACVKNCGKRFHQEIGKFRFLNEMIKVVSPKYLGSKTTDKVKKRIIEIIFAWTIGLPQETKILEAYGMLKAQGIVTEDPIEVEKKMTFDPFPPPEKPRNSIFRDDDKAKLLAKLLKSKHPEDLQAANRLIKNMVKQDAERTDKISKRVSQIDEVNNKVKLLSEMLSHYDPNSNTESDRDIMKEIYDSLEKMRPSLFRLASETEDQDNEGLNKILHANDDVMQVMSIYKRDVEKIVEEDGNTDTTTNKVGDSDMSTLLDLGLDAPPVPSITNGGGGDMAMISVDEELAKLGLIDTPSTSTTAVSTNTSQTSSDLNDLDGLFQASSLPSQPVIPMSTIQQFPTMGHQQNIFTSSHSNANYSIDLLSGPTTQPVATAVPTTTSSSSSHKKAMNDLDLLGKSLLQESLPIDRPIVVPSPAPKIPMNQMQKTTPSNHGNTTQLGSNQLPAVPLISSNQLPLPMVANSQASEFSEPINPTSLLSQISSPAPVLSLADVFVTLESIQPGTTAPLNAYDKDSIMIVIHFAKNRPRPDVVAMVVSMMSFNTAAVKNLVFQVAVPKTMKVKLQPPSGKELPPYNPIIPTSAITQVMLLANPNKEKVRLKFKVTYTINDSPISNVGEVDNFPMS